MMEERVIAYPRVKRKAREAGMRFVLGHQPRPFGVQRRRGDPPRYFSTLEELDAHLDALPPAKSVRY